ncbi:TPA: ATP-binding cassette domain-containing protein, partial [Staphylococcus aureus]|nr:ATP-binding cassette domain-containing protein [Staphylococcus aureus]
FITNSVYDEINIHFNHLSKDQSDDETIQLLKLLDLQNVKDQHPYELSIGQKRRLSVATALSSKADIIFLDEPTFGLDSHNTFQLIKLFQKRINLGQSIVMVTHDDEIIERYPSRRLKISDGALLDCDGDTNV